MLKTERCKKFYLRTLELSHKRQFSEAAQSRKRSVNHN